MYKYNGKVIRAGRSWTDAAGIKHPTNWMTWSDEEKLEKGLVWEDDPLPYDNRYFWDANTPKSLEDVPNVDENGDPILDEQGNQSVTKGLKSQAIEAIKQQAGSLLAPTDWMVVKSVEVAEYSVPATVSDYRTAVRAASNTIEAAILATTTVEELMALEYTWPEEV